MRKLPCVKVCWSSRLQCALCTPTDDDFTKHLALNGTFKVQCPNAVRAVTVKITGISVWIALWLYIVM